MSDELNLYDVEVNGVPTTLQLTEAEAALRFPGVKPKPKSGAKHAADEHVPNKAADDRAVANKARRNP